MDLLYRVKALWAALRGNHYTWPAIDIMLPGDRCFQQLVINTVFRSQPQLLRLSRLQYHGDLP